VNVDLTTTNDNNICCDFEANITPSVIMHSIATMKLLPIMSHVFDWPITAKENFQEYNSFNLLKVSKVAFESHF